MEQHGVNPAAIVIPSHGRADLLHAALGSALDQSRPPAVVVVVEDTESEDTEAVTARAADRGVAPVRFERNRFGGACHSRNIGANVAVGVAPVGHLSFLDDDCVLDRRFLETTSDALAATSSQLAVCGISLAATLAEVERGETQPFFQPPGDLCWRDLLVRNTGFGGVNFLVDCDLFFSVGGWDPSFASSQDRDLGVRLLRRARQTVVVDDALVTTIIGLDDRIGADPTRRYAGTAHFHEKYRRDMDPLSRWRSAVRVAHMRGGIPAATPAERAVGAAARVLRRADERLTAGLPGRGGLVGG